MKKLSSVALILALLLTLALPVLAAEASVVYSGHNIFGFGPGSEFTGTDLFPNFKQAMPGDVLTQTITVRNTASCCDFIRLYLRAEVHDGEGNPLSPNVAAEENLVSMQDFLSQLSMKIWNGDTLIYEASPDQLDGLAQKVLLGTFRRNQGTTLTVELTVPAELGNEYANRVGEVDWVFLIEEFDDETPDIPKTGDHTPVWLYMGLMALSLAVVLWLLVPARRRKEET